MMTKIKTWHERCMEHPDHQNGMVSDEMIRARMGEEIQELRAELEKRTKRHLKVLKELARGECEVAHVSDNGDMTLVFPRALYESQHSRPWDHHLIDLITSDPMEKQARAVTPRNDGWEENRREIWRARLAQMRRVGIVISEGKP